MDQSQLLDWLSASLGQEVATWEAQPDGAGLLQVAPAQIANICLLLHDSPETYFDQLSCISGVDNGKDAFEVCYQLYSIPYQRSLMLKVTLPRPSEGLSAAVPTVSHIWGSAAWFEREVFDLFGIPFEGHPDLRRILLPADWEGYPLRKDYQAQTTYHGIKVAY